ncbi:MAG: RNA polymerase sigma factor [Planctomycetota bacterium]|nr:RNA polymerase sigma factor [Planctomycetota bacterium]
MLLHPAASSAVRLPLNAPILRRLKKRKVRLELESGGDPELFEAQLETELMTLFRDEGDEGAFQALYDYSRGRMLIWIAGLLGSRRSGPDPLEILQDAYVNIYRYARSFRNEDHRSFRVWSRTIVGNLVRRAMKPNAARSFDDLPEGRSEPVDRRVSPAEALVHEEDARSTGRAWMIVLLQYAAAFERLSERDRCALSMIEVEGLSYAEAGARLHVGISNMKMIMFRSRRRIRSMISARFDTSVAERVSA